MKLVIVNGRGGVGKTSFEKMVQEIAAARGKTVKIISTIDYVKECASLLGWDGAKSKQDRRFLSDLKDALSQWKDIPYKKIQEKLKNYYSNDTENPVDMVFIDCREPNEIQRFVDEYNALTLLVQRGEFTQIMGNHADDNVLNYQYDITIDNSRGLNELMQEATIFVETFIED